MSLQTRYDQAHRRQGKRTGRERGVWLYVPAEDLAAAGIDAAGPPPFYRIWAGRRRSLTVTLYTSR